LLVRLRDSAKAKTAGLFLVILNVYVPNAAIAKDNYLEPTLQCPVVAPIRVASATSLGDFLSLKECAEQMVYAAPASIVSPPPVERIMGVKTTVPAADEGEQKAKPPCRGGRCKSHAALGGTSPHRNAMLYDGMIRQAAGTYRIDPLFLHALTWTESSYRPSAISSAGAMGLMQIMPNTGLGLGVARENLFDPSVNIDTGARLLKKLQRRYGRDLSLILAAYNAGEGAVEKYGRQIPPYR